MIGKRAVIAGVIFLGLAGAAGYKLYHPEPAGIVATGTIEVTRADITPKVGGYISGLTIQQGDKVQRGQVIARVVREDLQAQLLRDQLALDKAKAQLRDLEAGAREQERQDLLAGIASARSVRDKAQADYDRMRSLAGVGAVSSQQLDAARSALDVAQGSLDSLGQKLALLDAGNRPDVIEAQRLEVERSQAVVNTSEVLVNDAVVPAPLDGLVLTKNFENNEYVNPGVPIATVGDMNDCWVKVYVASGQLGRIAVGQAATVKVDSFPDQVFSGVIKEISQNAEFTPRQSITQRERANQVFAVKIKIDNAQGLLKPGMPADVVIQ